MSGCCHWSTATNTKKLRWTPKSCYLHLIGICGGDSDISKTRNFYDCLENVFLQKLSFRSYVATVKEIDAENGIAFSNAKSEFHKVYFIWM